MQSVTGPVDTAGLSSLLYHEHVILDTRRVPGLSDYWLPGADVMAKELASYGRLGSSAVISLTNITMGRDVRALGEVSRLSGVAILASTGLYTRTSAIAAGVVDDARALCQIFVRELTGGIDGTDVRAAVIGEIATGAWPVGKYERNLFDASAEAHLQTGAPIATHTFRGRYARWQVDYLSRRGVPADRIAIGHLDELIRKGRLDIECMAEIAGGGAYLGYDSVGTSYFSDFLGIQTPSDEDRAEGIAELVSMGFENKILLAHDLCRPRHLAINGGWGYEHIFSSFLPLLESRGIPRQVTRKFVRDNPIRWLTGDLA